MDEIRFEDSIKIGDSKIRVLFYERKGPLNIMYVHLHGDEPNARDAAIEMVNKYGGRVISFLHAEERYITFTLQGVEYSFDPNRMFSLEGIEASLKKKDKYTKITNYCDEARDRVMLFARSILTLYIDEAAFIIAPHNNSDGDYHAGLYLGGQLLGRQAEQNGVHIHTEVSPCNFFFLTDKKYWEQLVVLRFNVVLQNSNIEDDGSLSVFCTKKNIPYINCEVDVKSHEEQLRMLEAVFKLVVAEKTSK